MLRIARFVLAALASAVLFGCRTSEVKNNDAAIPGLMSDVPTGTVQSHYGTGRGDSVGGGGAAPALDLTQSSSKDSDSSANR